MSAIQLTPDASVYQYTDSDGDQVTVALRGPGSASLDLNDQGQVLSIALAGTQSASQLSVAVKRGPGGDGAASLQSITGSGVGNLLAPRVRLVGVGLQLDAAPAKISLLSLENGADLQLGPAPGTAPGAVVIDLQDAIGSAGEAVQIDAPSGIHTLRVRGTATYMDVQSTDVGQVMLRGSVVGLALQATTLGRLLVQSPDALLDASTIAVADDIGVIDVRGPVHDSLILAGAVLADGALQGGAFDAASIGVVRIGGDLVDSVIGAGADPGDDGLFADGEILDGGAIQRLTIAGLVVGSASEHINPGIYAAELGAVKINGITYTGKDPAAFAGAVMGNAVIDPLPTPAAALDVDTIEEILARAAERARQLNVNATISLVDREGNLLAVIRTGWDTAAPALTTVDIEAGGVGGLEAVDGIVSTSLIAATKAGTAAFLSTSGNAFTTRTAGYIIQQHFPPGIDLRNSGPLFGVQLSSLPTSDINRLPLGLSADPGGVPLYVGKQVVAGIGVEVDGIYTIDPSRVGGDATVEELIALAGQSGFAPPSNIRADRVTVDGIRLDYANANPPSLRKLQSAAAYDASLGNGDITELLAPVVSPASKFAAAALTGAVDGKAKVIAGEVPNNGLLDFFNDGTGEFAFLSGDLNAGEQLTGDDVEQILVQAHALNQQLRAQIRRDSPQRSQVTVSVVDLNGNVLGVFRTPDAPVFGYDVAVQKARTVAFLSRPDAGDQLRDLDADVDIATLQGLNGFVDPANNNPFADHVDASQDIGLDLDGSVAIAARTVGFVARPHLPDGINGANPGPLSAIGSDDFSVFNTGVQTLLLGPKLVEFLVAFNGLGEAAGLAAFAAGTLGGGGVVPSDSNGGGGTLNPGGGLNDKSLANGMQIFSGGVPLYKNGQLVGAIGVSGDGIEQDDFVAITGARGFQQFGPGVKRADQTFVAGSIRLPYVKLPRSPFGGL
jgi:uncharacterized protein GlcG (DUF336 family)